jgi:hypothetical protein
MCVCVCVCVCVCARAYVCVFLARRAQHATPRRSACSATRRSARPPLPLSRSNPDRTQITESRSYPDRIYSRYEPDRTQISIHLAQTIWLTIWGWDLGSIWLDLETIWDLPDLGTIWIRSGDDLDLIWSDLKDYLASMADRAIWDRSADTKNDL